MFTLAHKTRIQFIMTKSEQQGLEALVRKEKTLDVHVTAFCTLQDSCSWNDVIHNSDSFSNHNEYNLETPSPIHQEKHFHRDSKSYQDDSCPR